MPWQSDDSVTVTAASSGVDALEDCTSWMCEASTHETVNFAAPGPVTEASSPLGKCMGPLRLMIDVLLMLAESPAPGATAVSRLYSSVNTLTPFAAASKPKEPR